MLRHLFLALIGCAALHAAEIPLTDATVVPGERVGPIEKGMTLFGLKTLFGADKLKYVDLPGAEGETTPGAIAFKGTDREVQVVFNPDGDEKEIIEVRIVGKGWKFPDGLAKGASVAQVEKANGKPYKVSGFDWDYGGYADFTGGKLAGKVSVRFSHGSKELDKSLIGDRSIPSSDKKLRAAEVTAAEISVIFLLKTPAPEKP
ncbi:hypothetical protein KBB96_18025 [Luteolibacter ambystomatis]|uniref:Uncharacterized protein n=1 Tax=Luteolibacter ambystomatis TaxID=2824561 RepID=A0A975IYT8_9BACT|nr:hypothetical protein [Luteolibacter ambystomatis]QUE50746.1 hypothetical protein KBB96_18025 [Luteolibacter ambystomatis]